MYLNEVKQAMAHWGFWEWTAVVVAVGLAIDATLSGGKLLERPMQWWIKARQQRAPEHCPLCHGRGLASGGKIVDGKPVDEEVCQRCQGDGRGRDF